MRRVVSFIPIVATLACGGSTPQSPVNLPNDNPVPATSVSVNDNSFSPDAAEISINVPMTWTWKGSAQHNITFEDGQASSGTKAAGTHSRTFTSVGTYRYRCTIHSSGFTSGMVGSVVVD